MSASQDYVALDWIKDEIGQILNQAQQALEMVAESPYDASSLRACLTAIHQVNGTLQMVQLDGPTQVAQEMESVAQSLMNNSVPDVAQAQEILMQSILQMPAYLDRIHREQKDAEANYMPIVYNLRVARGEPNIGGDFAQSTGPNLLPFVTPGDEETVAAFEGGNGPANAPKLRQKYQQSLVAVIKKSNARENLTVVGKVFTMLSKLCGRSPIGHLSQLGLATIEGITSGAIKLDATSANLLKNTDKVLKTLSESGAKGLADPVPEELVLGFIALLDGASTETPKIVEAKSLYQSEAGVVDVAIESVAIGPDDETLAAVAKILKEELARVTDKLDLFVRSTARSTDDLVELLPMLEQISSTLVVVGLAQHQETVSSQVAFIQSVQKGEASPDEEHLLDMARALIEIEVSLGILAGDSGEDGEIGDLNDAQAAVVRETRNGLAHCKDAVIEFVSSEFDHSKLEDLADELRALRGGLMIANQERSGDVLVSASYYVTQVLDGKLKPELSEMDDLADAVTSIDYYLERLLESANDPYIQMIEVAEQAVEKLGFPVGVEPEVVVPRVATEETVTAIEETSEVVEESDVAEAGDDDLIDEEILEIFVEEAEEVLESINEFLPVWRDNNSDTDSLVELRRAFHTLKGSGRMVGANVLGELAWSIENMLNRVMDNTISPSDDMLNLMNAVVDRIPEGVEAFREQHEGTFEVQEMIDAAEALINGESVGTGLPAEKVIEQVAEEIIEEAVEEVVEEAVVVEEVEEDIESEELVLADESDKEQEIIEAVEEGRETLTDIPQEVVEAEDAEPAGSEVIPEVSVEKLLEADDLSLEEIFVIEANEKIDLVKSFLAAPGVVDGDIAAAFHTLKGSAAMAEIPTISQIAAPLEQLALDYLGKQADDWCITKMRRGSGLIEQVIANIELHRDMLPGVEEFTQQFQERKTEPVAVFKFDAIELLGSVSLDAESWPIDNLTSLVAELAHVKEQAEESGQANLSALSDGLLNAHAVVGTTPSVDIVEALQSSHDELLVMLDQIAAGQTVGEAETLVGLMSLVPPLPSQQEQASVEDLVELPADDVDEDILPIFLEETEELLEGIDESIQSWSEDPSGSTKPLDMLLRHLHTLKGGSRMAGLNSLGEYTHNFETYLIGTQSNPVELDENFFALVNAQQDEMTRRVEIYSKLATGQATDGELQSLLTSTVPVVAEEVVIAPATDKAPSKADTEQDKATAPAAAQEMVRVSSDLLEELIGLAGESSINRGRVEQQITDFGRAIQEMEDTINRIRDQVRRLEIEAESRETLITQHGDDSSFDELEMDRYTMLQEISRSLNEGSSDMMDLKDTLVNRSRDAETLLHQQARIAGELQEGLTRTRMVPFAKLIPRLRRIVRQISGEIGKSVRFDAFNVEGELDRSVLDRIVAPLEHMLRNAVDHGVESTEKRKEVGKPEQGCISLRLSREGGYVILTISDDGGGIAVDVVRRKAVERGLITEDSDISDHEVMQFIMHAGFSTAQKLTQISGRGVGMDVVSSEIKALGGSITIDSTLGVGTEFTIRIPFTVSINRALMVVVKEETYAIPLNTIHGIQRVSPYELEAYYQPEAPQIEIFGQPYRLEYLGKMLDKSENPKFEGQVAPLPVILASSGDDSVALQVDRVIGSREVVVKTLGPQFSEVGGISGATILGDGSVVVILDVMALVCSYEVLPQTESAVQIEIEEVPPEPQRHVRTVMIVDDSVTVRKVTSRLMERQGWEVVLAKDGLDAVTQLQDIYPDVVLLDIEMPKMDGFEVLRRVRADERLKSLPIIMITSRTGEKHQQQALELGVNQFLGKPFQEAGLLSTIEEVIGSG